MVEIIDLKSAVSLLTRDCKLSKVKIEGQKKKKMKNMAKDTINIGKKSQAKFFGKLSTLIFGSLSHMDVSHLKVLTNFEWYSMELRAQQPF